MNDHTESLTTLSLYCSRIVHPNNFSKLSISIGDKRWRKTEHEQYRRNYEQQLSPTRLPARHQPQYPYITLFPHKCTNPPPSQIPITAEDSDRPVFVQDICSFTSKIFIFFLIYIFTVILREKIVSRCSPKSL